MSWIYLKECYFSTIHFVSHSVTSSLGNFGLVLIYNVFFIYVREKDQDLETQPIDRNQSAGVE